MSYSGRNDPGFVAYRAANTVLAQHENEFHRVDELPSKLRERIEELERRIAIIQAELGAP